MTEWCDSRKLSCYLSRCASPFLLHFGLSSSGAAFIALQHRSSCNPKPLCSPVIFKALMKAFTIHTMVWWSALHLDSGQNQIYDMKNECTSHNTITWSQHFYNRSINAIYALLTVSFAVRSSVNVYHRYPFDFWDAFKLDHEKRIIAYVSRIQMNWVVERVCVAVTSVNSISQRSWQMWSSVDIGVWAWRCYQLS